MDNANKLDLDSITELLPELIDYIKDALLYSQVQISLICGKGFSESTISNLKKGKAYAYKGNPKRLFTTMLAKFEISLTLNDGKYSFSDGNMGLIINKNTVKTYASQTFFESNKGNIWKIYIQHKTNIIVKFLKINSLADVEYIVNSKDHKDYIGTGELTNTGSNLSFNLSTRESNKKDLHIRFWIGDKNAQPDIMLGILVYSLISSNYMEAYCVVAVNSSKDDNIIPYQLPIEDCKETFITDYFSLRPSNIYAPPGMLRKHELISYIKHRKLNKYYDT